MNFGSYVEVAWGWLVFSIEGPLLGLAFLTFLIGVGIRLIIFICKFLISARQHHPLFILSNLSRIFLPYHMAAFKKPVFITLLYIFHICMFIVPVWLTDHIELWRESSFELYWSPLPEEWADRMTLTVLFLAAFSIIRRFIHSELRRNSTKGDYLFVTLIALPFLTGYLSTHRTLEGIHFLGENLLTLHILSGEIMLIMVVFLFCQTRLKDEQCTGCTACVTNCPSIALEFKHVDYNRVFIYHSHRCISCASCVSICPEKAAELKHVLSLRNIFFCSKDRQEIQSIELEVCQKCNAFFAPKPQVEKIGNLIKEDYLHRCPKCRAADVAISFYPRKASRSS